LTFIQRVSVVIAIPQTKVPFTRAKLASQLATKTHSIDLF